MYRRTSNERNTSHDLKRCSNSMTYTEHSWLIVFESKVKSSKGGAEGAKWRNSENMNQNFKEHSTCDRLLRYWMNTLAEDSFQRLHRRQKNASRGGRHPLVLSALTNIKLFTLSNQEIHRVLKRSKTAHFLSCCCICRRISQLIPISIMYFNIFRQTLDHYVAHFLYFALSSPSPRTTLLISALSLCCSIVDECL